MVDIMIASDLWGSSMLPEGILEQWLVPNGKAVRAGELVAVVRIEDALHEIAAPVAGMLARAMKPNEVFEPGAIIGQVERQGIA